MNDQPAAPETTPTFEALQRVEAAHILASASGHSFDDSLLIVAALENNGVFIVREVVKEHFVGGLPL